MFDLGLSTTLNRELARLRPDPEKAQTMRDLLHSMELIYWAISLTLGAVVFALSTTIATHWIHPAKLSTETAAQAFTLMGLVTIFQWPAALYSGALMGLQRQVTLNAINITMATLRGLGALAALRFIAPTIQVFFIWQLMVSALQTFITRRAALANMPATSATARFRKDLVASIGHFAAGLTGITVLAVLITQMDKVVLSGTLSLKDFGYYAIAATAAGGLSYLVGPVFTATFPRFTELVALSDDSALARLYHETSQLMALMILPAAVILIFFSREIVLLWTHDAQLAASCYLIVRLLAIGNALNGLMNIPYALQLANGWTSLNFYGYLISAVFMVPLIFFASRQYGGVGAASAWVCLNAVYFLVAMHIMYGRLLSKEKAKWYLVDVALPLGTAVLIAAAGKPLYGRFHGKLGQIIALAGISCTALVATAAMLPEIRLRLRSWLRGTVNKSSEAVSAIIT